MKNQFADLIAELDRDATDTARRTQDIRDVFYGTIPVLKALKTYCEGIDESPQFGAAILAYAMGMIFRDEPHGEHKTGVCRALVSLFATSAASTRTISEECDFIQSPDFIPPTETTPKE